MSLADIDDGATCDVIVLGAGGAGMTAALSAAIDGASVLLVESSALVGGTTSYSQGLMWLPGTHHAGFVHPAESVNDARRYLDATIGSRGDALLREAFLQRAAAAAHRLERESLVSLRVTRDQPDYHPECAGAAAIGRVLEPTPFDGRTLGADFDLLRPPPREAMWHAPVLGGSLMLDHDDAAHVARWYRSARSLRHVAGLGLRHVGDRLTHDRGTRLMRGHALAAQLLASLRRRRIGLVTSTRAIELTGGPSAIDGVVLVQDGCTRHVRARGGVVLATGGFTRHPAQRAARLPDIDPEWSASAPGPTGLAVSLAEARGAAWGSGAVANAYLAPVSLRRRGDGSTAIFAHLERVPRHVFVDADGDCDVDAGMPHHAAALAMHDAMTMPVYLVTDAHGMQSHGLGMVGPGGRGLDEALADGYVRRAHDLREFARTLQVPAVTLERQLRRHLARAYAGVTRLVEFVPPYYAVDVLPGDLGAACGLSTDEHARVLDTRGDPLWGLYAVGSDMHSIMGGVLPAPGCMLGPAIVFAVIAANNAVARARRAMSKVIAADAASRIPPT